MMAATAPDGNDVAYPDPRQTGSKLESEPDGDKVAVTTKAEGVDGDGVEGRPRGTGGIRAVDRPEPEPPPEPRPPRPVC
jgi:hypothetical protein